MKDFKVYQASGYLTKLVTDASDVRKIYDEISGSLVEFDTPISAPLAELIVDINPVQDLHGQDAPYPAGGGKNKLNPNVVGYDFATWLEYNTAEEKYTIKQGSGLAPSPIPINNPIQSGTEVTVSVFVESGQYTTGYISIGGYHNSSPPSWQGGSINLPLNTNLAGKVYTTTGTTTADLDSLEIFVYSTPTITTNIVFRVQIEIGATTPTEWSPYSNICPITGWTGCEVWVKDEYDTSLPATATVTFPDGQTVYGGTVDFTTGLLTVDRASVDLGTLDWTLSGSRFQSNSLIEDIKTSPTDYFSYLLCSILKPDNSPITTQTKDNTIATYNKRLYALASAYGDATAFKNAMNGQQLVYELATPITYQLTPQEIITLVGVNNIWADTGDVSVKYRTH